MPKIERILIPTDFSTSSEAAALYGIWLSHQLNAQVELLHAWDLPGYMAVDTAYDDEGNRRSMEDFANDQIEQMMNDFVATLEKSIDKKDPDEKFIFATPRLHRGDAAETIVDVAREQEVDLIVMGTHGRKGLRHLLVGSVAERVVRMATCPVLTVGPETISGLEIAHDGEVKMKPGKAIALPD